MTDKFSLLAWETYLNVTRFPEHEGLTVADVKAAFLAGATLHEDKLAIEKARVAKLKDFIGEAFRDCRKEEWWDAMSTLSSALQEMGED